MARERLIVEVLASVQDSIVEACGRIGPVERLLDVGCWDGEATLRYAEVSGACAAGIEVYPEPSAEARERGIEVVTMDVEHAPFPFEPSAFDAVVCNQVFEHLKNIFQPADEIYRVLAPGGHLVISVPNLASLHNRVLLLLGRQPTSIRVVGPHVRGFAGDQLVRMFCMDGRFSLVDTLPNGFYPFRGKVAKRLARLWPGASHTVVYVLRREAAESTSTWAELANAAGEQTHFD